MRLTNEMVINSFIEGLESKSNNLSTDGSKLYSYDSLLAYKLDNKIILIEAIAKYSNTSAKHASLLSNALELNDRLYIHYHNGQDSIEFSYIYEIVSLFKKYIRAHNNKEFISKIIDNTQKEIEAYIDSTTYKKGVKLKYRSILKNIMFEINNYRIWKKPPDMNKLAKLLEPLTN